MFLRNAILASFIITFISYCNGGSVNQQAVKGGDNKIENRPKTVNLNKGNGTINNRKISRNIQRNVINNVNGNNKNSKHRNVNQQAVKTGKNEFENKPLTLNINEGDGSINNQDVSQIIQETIINNVNGDNENNKKGNANKHGNPKKQGNAHRRGNVNQQAVKMDDNVIEDIPRTKNFNKGGGTISNQHISQSIQHKVVNNVNGDKGKSRKDEIYVKGQMHQNVIGGNTKTHGKSREFNSDNKFMCDQKMSQSAYVSTFDGGNGNDYDYDTWDHYPKEELLYRKEHQ